MYVGKPYGALRRIRKAEEQLPAKLSPGKRLSQTKELMIGKSPPLSLSNRTNMIAWFNSHCPTDGLREVYFKNLAEHVQLDIYGSCGKMQCLPRNDPKCDSVLDKYKFYLAAENSLCIFN